MLQTLEGRKRIMAFVALDKERTTFRLSLSSVFVTSLGPCVNWERRDIGRGGFNLWTKYRRQREKEKGEKEEEIFCSSVVFIEYLRIKRFEDCPVASFSRALRDDFYVTCFRGILAESFLSKKRIFSTCFYYEIVFVILIFYDLWLKKL